MQRLSVHQHSMSFVLNVVLVWSCISSNNVLLSDLQPCCSMASMCSRGLLFVYQMHLIDYLITLVSVCLCVCLSTDRLSNDYVRNSLPFSPNFACRSEIWLFWRLLFLGQTGSRLPIVEMCKIRFWQFRRCGGHIFPRIVTKTRTEI